MGALREPYDLSAIIGGVVCSKGCPQGGKCFENLGTIRVLKICATESFGDAALLEQWDGITPNHKATGAWFALAYGSRIVDASGAVTDVLYRVDGKLVCMAAWAAMRGIPPTTAKPRQQPLTERCGRASTHGTTVLRAL